MKNYDYEDQCRKQKINAHETIALWCAIIFGVTAWVLAGFGLRHLIICNH